MRGGSDRHTLLSAHPLLYVGPLSLMILLGFAATIATVASLLLLLYVSISVSSKSQLLAADFRGDLKRMGLTNLNTIVLKRMLYNTFH